MCPPGPLWQMHRRVSAVKPGAEMGLGRRRARQVLVVSAGGASPRSVAGLGRRTTRPFEYADASARVWIGLRCGRLNRSLMPAVPIGQPFCLVTATWNRSAAPRAAASTGRVRSAAPQPGARGPSGRGVAPSTGGSRLLQAISAVSSVQPASIGRVRTAEREYLRGVERATGWGGWGAVMSPVSSGMCRAVGGGRRCRRRLRRSPR
jgi:hypothetical protein